ncbi:gfo/Idh/MocA family oxidoreductase [Echinicola strongylocentroti]|uniref:Gfo/Idh/MocA family oxidoreductase n=1 Tax=Echinicola strongylocentroti TaxID=1795355 RepID=A0A2Z4IKH7_9BACT|nr:Gfo/Idh/MocA family oxidoreductase [Echinicola strongylocentroti]AWW31209.1 gfo/Idh/MocA family oxidoreductase [Echinicola strongylocentroti]
MKIQLIGAGGIVKDAHLPAYKIAGYEVEGIFDLNEGKAAALAEEFGIPGVFASLDELVAHAGENSVFDVAVPGSAVLEVLEKLPDGAVVLIQKPMGQDLAAAKAILALCRKKQLKAGVNFQMRYAPYIQKAREIIDSGQIGELCDIEIKINVYTPWHLWDFLFTAARVEILYHSIHYVDLVRSFYGNPKKVYAKTIKHPKMSQLASVKTNIIMDYGELKGANILTNHAHEFGQKHQQSYVKLEGTKGAIMIEMGLMKNYPVGTADKFEYVVMEEGKEPEWKEESIEGTWFPHAFVGSMAEMKKALENPKYIPDNSVEDCIYTMACVEAAHQSNEVGGVELSTD